MMEKRIQLFDLAGKRLGMMIIDDQGNISVDAEGDEERAFLEKIADEISNKQLVLRGAKPGDSEKGDKETFYEKMIEKGDEAYYEAVIYELTNYDVRTKRLS
jgi:hypothetical protein